eukprot:9189850-Heterocapsa_arctica.AAC.1
MEDCKTFPWKNNQNPGWKCVFLVSGPLSFVLNIHEAASRESAQMTSASTVFQKCNKSGRTMIHKWSESGPTVVHE